MLPPASISIAPMSPAFIKDFEDKKYQKFSFVKNDYTPWVVHPKEPLKDQQMIAGMAFRFFGLHNMPIYKGDTTFLVPNNNAQLSTPATQLLNKLQMEKTIANDGSIYCNRISKYKSDLEFEKPDNNILSFSVALKEEEIVLVYNTSKSEAYEKFILLNHITTKFDTFFSTIYGYEPNSFVQVFHGLFNNEKRSYIRLFLKPMQLIILKNYS